MTLVATLNPVSPYPIGTVKWWAGSFAVTGEVIVKTSWLACNGALVDRTTYAKLFAKIGFAYSPIPGNDPGSNKFYLPDHTDAKNFVPKGTTFSVIGTKAGAKVIALASNGSQDPAHVHGVVQHNMTFPGGGTDGGVGPLVGAEPGSGLGGHTTPTTGNPTGRSTNAPQTHQNMPPVRVTGGKIILYH